MLQRGTPKMRPKRGKDHQPVKDRHGNPVYETVKDKNGKVVYEPYRIKVLNTINFKKSIFLFSVTVIGWAKRLAIL